MNIYNLSTTFRMALRININKIQLKGELFR